MQEHPLLMKGPLVRATLEGRKTQTRRPIKRENKPDPGFEWAECLCREIDPSDTPCATCAARFPGLAAAGDRLWVRETWTAAMHEPKGPADCLYRADDNGCVEDLAEAKWTPSIHMPRWACRLRLPLVKVRIERVQWISEADAWAEGYGEHWQRRVKEAGADGPLGRPSPQAWFATLWDKLYGTWGQNPWVAVYEWGQIEVSR
ncbi:MAG: hypothetical protein E6Q97_22480 [Desulfurellales bacterium]|nr:MAG: hypothetical protein E6Q97_22480 [Desulfurellales bacterium]